MMAYFNKASGLLAERNVTFTKEAAQDYCHFLRPSTTVECPSRWLFLASHRHGALETLL